MKILVTGSVPKEGLTELYKYFEVTHSEERFLRQEVLSMLPDYDGVLLAGVRADKEFIDAGTKLKIIAVHGVGYDNVDISYARNKGIAVANSPTAVTEATAELAFTLMLDVARRVSEYDRALRQGVWMDVSDRKNMGVSLYRKTLGIFGLGRIGKSMALRAKAFGMKVIYYKLSRLSAEEERELGLTYVSFADLLQESDVISIHAPLTDTTHHCFGEAQLAKMKPSAYLINTGRGRIIDEAALIKALQNKVIAGAGLDVFANEPVVSPELLTMANVVLAPHVGTGCLAARTEMAQEASENIISFLCRNIPRNVVNR